MLKAMQKAKNANCTLKLPIKTRWAFMVTSLESVKKIKEVQHKIAVSEEPEKKQQLVRRSPTHSSGRRILA